MPINPLAQIPNEQVPNITINQNGWSAELGLATRTNDDLTTSLVFQIVDWVGGIAIKPAVGAYIGEDGLVLNIDDAVDVRGSSGTIQTTMSLLRLLVAPESTTFYVTDLDGIFVNDSTDTTTADDGEFTIVTANSKRFKKKASGSGLVITDVAGFAKVNDKNGDTVIWNDTSRGGDFKWFESGYSADGGIVFAGKTGFWVRTETGSIDVKWFGAIDDYNGATGTDNRSAIQSAIDTASTLRRTLKIDGKRFLVNSYTSDTGLATAHFNILNLKSNLSIEVTPNTEIVVGDFFDNKSFILFSGFNAVSTGDFTDLSNIYLSGGGIVSFNGVSSQMRSSYKRRLCFEGGRCTTVSISNLTFTNGDLSNCLAFGFGAYGYNITVENNLFYELSKSDVTLNSDHSTIYCNATLSTVRNNKFIGTATSTALVGCACELHGSQSYFIGNKVTKYTRSNYITATAVEKGDISQIEISGNSAEVTNSGVYLWADGVQKISNVIISNNNYVHSHVDGFTSLYNGVQAIALFEEKGGTCENIQIKNNSSTINYNIVLPEQTKIAVQINCSVTNVEISYNTLNGHEYGFTFKKEAAVTDPSITFMTINNNVFKLLRKLFYANASGINYLTIKDNQGTLAASGLQNIIELASSGTMLNSTIANNTYKEVLPLTEFTPIASFLASSTNYAKYILGDQDLVIPVIDTVSTGVSEVAVSSSHQRANSAYVLNPLSVPSELAFCNHTVINGANDVLFITYNRSVSSYPGTTVSCYITVELK